MLAIEGRWVSHVEAARRGVLRIVEPETDVEGVGRSQQGRRIEAEDLVEQNRLDGDFRIAIAVSFEIRLIPREAEVLEVRIDLAARLQVRALRREQIEREVRLQVVRRQDQDVTEFAALYRDGRGRLVAIIASQALNEWRVYGQREGTLRELRPAGHYRREHGQDSDCDERQTFHFFTPLIARLGGTNVHG